MRCFVTGGAGYVGSHLVDLLLAEGHEVVVYDNLSTGKGRNLLAAGRNPKFEFVQGNIVHPHALQREMAGSDIVFHVAANADIRHGLEHPGLDLEQNTTGTFNVLEAMRANGIKRIAFTSTCSVYGETKVHPTPEDAPFPIQTSLYGASKVAGEALIQAYCEGFGFQAYITRHVGMLGERYSHGHIIDWYQRLYRDRRLTILGDGSVRKSYLYVKDAVRGILTAVEKSQDKINIFNLGSDEYCSVNQSATWFCEYMGAPSFTPGQGDRGWIGDNPFIWLDCSRIRALGWQPTLTIQQSIHRTIDYLKENGA